MPKPYSSVIKRTNFEIEINSATDNPLIFGESKRSISGGNFHGEYVAKCFDVLGIYTNELNLI